MTKGKTGMTKRMKKYWPILLVLILSFWAAKPILHSGFFPIHDNTQAVRVSQMAQALSDGQFPVRWVKDLGYGYGYPIFNFYAPLPYYVGALFNLVGFNILTAAKLMMVVGILLSGVFMYFLGKEFWGIWGGVIAALFYVYAPYHAVDIYVRGAVGEFWALAFLPLVFLGIYRISQSKGFLTASLGFCGVILSHNLTAIMTIPFIFLLGFLMFIISKEKKLFLIHYSLFIIFALGQSAFYWLPAVAEKDLTRVNQMVAQSKTWEHLVYWDQFWNSLWGFAGSAAGRLDGMSFMIGKLHLIFSVLSLMLATIHLCHSGLDPESIKKRYRKKLPIISVFFLFLLVSLFLSSDSSSFLWQKLRFLDVLQYPWRFLIFATLTTSFMAGSVVFWFKKNPNLVYVVAGLMTLLLLFFNTKYFQAQEHFYTTAFDYLQEENIKWSTSKISDEYLPRDFPIPIKKSEVAWEKIVVVKGEAEIKDLVSESNKTKFQVNVQTETEILINTAYFPGWKIRLNGEKIDFTLDGGKPKFSLPAGSYQVLVRLINTPIRTIANLISLIFWLSLGVFFLIQKKKKIQARATKDSQFNSPARARAYSFKKDKRSSHMQIASWIKNLKSKKIIDLGCAGGFLSQALGDNWQGVLVGIDKDIGWQGSPGLARYKKIFWIDLESDSFIKNLSKDKFDTLVMADILEHLKNPHQVLKKSNRLIQPKGRVIVSLPNASFFPTLLIQKLFPDFRMSRGPLDRTHKHFYNLSAAKKLFQENGFVIKKIKSTATPLFLIHKAFSKGELFYFLDSINSFLAKNFPRFFSYQYLFVLEPDFSNSAPQEFHGQD